MLRAGLDEIGSALASAKEASLEPPRELQSSIAQLQELIDALLQATQTVTALLTDAMGQISDSLAQCESLPDILQMIIDESLAVSGEGEATSFGELRAAWQRLGPMIGEASDAARARMVTGTPPED